MLLVPALRYTFIHERPRETVRKGIEQRTNHEFGQYAEHQIGQEEASQQPIGLILRACLRPSNRFLEDDLS
jgi:hypothetical protein